MKEPENWLRDFILERLDHDGSVVAIFVGRTGSSKSGSAISLAYAMDPTFNLDRIVFSVDEFFRISTENNLPPGSFLIFDDAGVGVGSRDWQDEKNKSLGAILQTFRYKQLPTLITTPRISFIDKQVRESVELQFVATDTKGMFKPFVLYESPKMDGKIWHSYPSVGGTEIKLWPFPPPPQELFEQYEKKKDAAFQKMLKEKFAEIKQEEDLRRTMLETKAETMRRHLEILRMREEREESRNESQLRQQTAMEEKKRAAAEREAMRLSKEKMKFETELRKQQTRQEIQEERERDRIASLERKARMVRMREEGMTYREIAEREKVTDRYVMRVVRGR
ncbi:MAG: hypothetical protein M1375_00290 [Candidatus Thermoplasmatota archaeon]|nr:hypothetical protein [Candidatus Thermoplasmatota archaeon]